MKRLRSKFLWMILLGFLAANLLTANPGWTADTDSQRLSALPAFVFLPLIRNIFQVSIPAQKAAIAGAEMLLLATEEGS
jgi:hypothetical protein